MSEKEKLRTKTPEVDKILHERYLVDTEDDKQDRDYNPRMGQVDSEVFKAEENTYLQEAVPENQEGEANLSAEEREFVERYFEPAGTVEEPPNE